LERTAPASGWYGRRGAYPAELRVGLGHPATRHPGAGDLPEGRAGFARTFGIELSAEIEGPDFPHLLSRMIEKGIVFGYRGSFTRWTNAA
jgi:hypothetical protein